MNVLFVAAHPDDLELNAAGTLLKYRKAGHKCFIALTTSGNIGSNVIKSKEDVAKTREGEAQAAAKILGAEIMFLRFNDERLFNNDESRTAVLNALRWANPDVIFTHSPEDKSPDHHTTSQIVQDAILLMPVPLLETNYKPCTKKASLFFWETTAGVDFQPEAYVDITDTIEDKVKALECHTSQYEWMDSFMLHRLVDMPKMVNAFRGLQNDMKYAEAFKAFRLHGFMPNYKLLP